MVPWCSGLAYVPVKDEIAGSNPVGTAASNSMLPREERGDLLPHVDTGECPPPEPRRCDLRRGRLAGYQRVGSRSARGESLCDFLHATQEPARRELDTDFGVSSPGCGAIAPHGRGSRGRYVWSAEGRTVMPGLPSRASLIGSSRVHRRIRRRSFSEPTPRSSAVPPYPTTRSGMRPPVASK